MTEQNFAKQSNEIKPNNQTKLNQIALNLFFRLMNNRYLCNKNSYKVVIMAENQFNYRKRIADVLLEENAEANDGDVFHYRDKSGLECDTVIHLRNGSYGLIEIKLGGDTLIAEGTANLNNLAEKIDTTKMKKPSFKMVLTAVGEYAYMRTDGVMVVPIGCLKD